MDDSRGEGTRSSAAEELILRTIAAHADSLLRTARRHSICVDDAQDAYQRAIEIFMAHAQRLDAGRAAGWLHVVVKREAQSIRRSRHKLLTSVEVDLDAREASSLPTADEQVVRVDMLSRSAEALQRLKPQELRALWLRAQGHSYSDIAAITGWSYSKVNRCLSEGRQAFLERYAGIESGAECARWLPVMSAMVDGQATAQDILELRPHLRNCPGCRATLKALQESSRPLAALLPVPLAVIDGATGDHVTSLLMRLYEGFAGGLHERAVHSLTRTQALVEASAAGKVAAVAASAAAVAGGGYASVERIAERPADVRAAARGHVHRPAPAKLVARLSQPADRPVSVTPVAGAASSAAPAVTTPPPPPPPDEFGAAPASRRSGSAPEFHAGSSVSTLQARAAYAAATQSPPATATAQATRTAPEFASQASAAEFSP
jgi:RNA polymerase sigma factor (sigma-70 family)